MQEYLLPPLINLTSVPKDVNIIQYIAIHFYQHPNIYIYLQTHTAVTYHDLIISIIIICNTATKDDKDSRHARSMSS